MTDGRSEAFPIVKLIMGLLVVAGMVMVVMVGVLPGFETDVARARSAVLATGSLVVLATLVGVVPVVVLAPRGGNSVIAGWLVGGAVRLAVSIVAAVVLVKGVDLPARSVLLTLAVVYLALLAVETVVVVRFVSRSAA